MNLKKQDIWKGGQLVDYDAELNYEIELIRGWSTRALGLETRQLLYDLTKGISSGELLRIMST